ncbi:maltokinase N-terminal cap-like domain-containing protein [Microbacterium sp. SLBN-146]|uniref:maltokinase N-terminal cap-like domain-containing protein n=1 Tax=Microbacterium sp. SLBN-146 TaxID=2768457 RepID=UPI00114DF143|nr:phosphotransferase [Microbacterium sp. SLBN-146]TQJ31794.1 trehalose synthase-fused probable maltokinase [Microbacterium sp. SLBN-146]
MDSTLACLAAWMPRQRWYAAKGRPPSLRLIAWWELPAPDAAGTRLRTYLVADEGALPVVLYQIPIVARATETVDAHPDHIIGSPEPGTTFIDGPFDPAFTDALVRLMLSGGTGAGPRATAKGVVALALPGDSPRSATVLTGEQSNTSVIYESAVDDEIPIIVKLYRQVHPGLNPDIELASALAAAGSAHVPRAVGAIEGTWPDSETARGGVTGSFAFAQEFLPDVEDAWRVALQSAAAGDDFRERAAALGTTTAEVHLSLARLFPTTSMDAHERESTQASWTRRLAIASAEVPGIAERREQIEDVYRRAATRRWPAAQRIHGDYHLGQVLHVPKRGWVLVDFEGEPLRPMSERTRPDLALRDVAGMLRSFDYVAGSIRLDDPRRDAASVRDWARSARTAFIDAYAAASGTPLDRDDPLLAALELDKAVYESIYESRNRPTWVSIPLRAIERLVGA